MWVRVVNIDKLEVIGYVCDENFYGKICEYYTDVIDVMVGVWEMGVEEGEGGGEGVRGRGG